MNAELKYGLVNAIQTHGLVYAPNGQLIELASGALSKYYFDFDLVVMVPSAMRVVVEALLDVVRDIDYNAIGGPSSGADPIIGALMAHLHPWVNISGKQVRGFKVRKEPKGRGPSSGSMIEGYLNAGDKAIVIEDVTTSGGSVLKAINEIEKVGAKVVKVITLLDRLAGAAQKCLNIIFRL